MEIKNTKKYDNSFQAYSCPEINVIKISAGKVICTSGKASTDTEAFFGETPFIW